MMAKLSKIMSINAQSKRCKPKKKYDHSAFGIRCTNQTAMATSLCPRRHTRQAASAFAKYSTVQTGPNSHAGGFQSGLAKLAYQGPGANMAPKAAVKMTAARKIANAAKPRLFTRVRRRLARTSCYFLRAASAASISARSPASSGLTPLG